MRGEILVILVLKFMLRNAIIFADIDIYSLCVWNGTISVLKLL